MTPGEVLLVLIGVTIGVVIMQVTDIVTRPRR